MEGQRREHAKQPEPKTRKPKKRRDIFRGNITGFIDVARNTGDVIAYSETTYAGGAEESTEPTQVPRPTGHKTRTQDESHVESEGVEDESETSDDDGGGGGAIFYGEISGFVKEARGTGNAVAMKKVTYAGTSRENSLNNSRGANPVQQRLRSQEQSEIMESRNIIRGLNQEPIKIGANNPQRTTERQHAPSRAFPQQHQVIDVDVGALTKEFQTVSPEMQRFIASLARQGSVSMEDER